jgi:ATP-dependent DNA helicase RecG
MFEMLSSGPFATRRVALLHGRLPAAERDEVMRRFRDRQIDLLVATTVIEVGIDVPNATVMLVEHPERFGLSQLHQLRGRVGRGAEESYCILLGDVSPEVAERLRIFTSTEDGFEIAREDLRMRGMGDLFGERQSGVPTFVSPIRCAMRRERSSAGRRHALGARSDSIARSRGLVVLGGARSLELFRVVIGHERSEDRAETARQELYRNSQIPEGSG